MKRITTIYGYLTFLALILSLGLPAASAAARLKDLASVKGVRQNQLVGYGLVVGLSGTGDGSNTAFTSQGFVNMMENMGVHVSRENLRLRNVASVMVTAKLPPFAKTGQNIDITISSLGDATSLQGGTLVATPLKGLDGQVYAMAQGPISIGGFPVAGGGMVAGAQKNHQTVARIPAGASVEREVPVTFAGREEIAISLDAPDFTTVTRMVRVINGFLSGSYARAQDGATVQVSVPEAYRHNEVALLAALEKLEVAPDGPARIILDERTGTVVMGGDVRIARLVLSHGNLSLQIADDSEPMAGRRGDRLVTLQEGTTIGEVARALNSVGASPQDLVAIFQSIKAAGALQAELEII